MNEPAKHAETMRDAYQTYLQGRGGWSARSVASRLQPDSAGEATLAGMRGPYLQALPIANWSETNWETFAKSQPLHPNITRAFHQEGFRRLYNFQERSVERVLGGDDTVISAATGRGKTEAWLIPILDQIVKEKAATGGRDRTSTKALLMYPTKALAQDQFKRLVQILYRINRNLRQKEWVTIGIYDGDTPRHKYESKAQGYLNRTFRHFSCPGANDDLSKCQSCGQGVFVEGTTDGYRLRPDKPMCEDDRPNHVPLDFVRLTRSEVINQGADIILTNPDTVNYRLFNVNADTEQQAFVYEPRFLVFDEVHTYDGLLGSYTATLVKRLRHLRERRGVEQLQVIGSSATVQNDVELFRQISGANDVSAVSEDPRELDGSPPETIPSALTTTTIASDAIVDSGRERNPTPPQLGGIELNIENATHLDNERLEEQVSEELFDYYTQSEPTDPVVKTFQVLHEALSSDPRPPQEFVTDCAERFGLSPEEADTLVDNFETIGQFAGLLESRHHLFSWPLDGFYACAACQAVYRSPQDSCSVCDSGFVTRATYCGQCGDEYLVANACSRCDQLTSYTHTDEGHLGDDEFQYCPHCSASGNDVTMHRVTFRPYAECRDCGTVESRSVTASCEACGSPGVPTDHNEFECRNPACGATWRTKALVCSDCESEHLTPATIDDPVDCPTCGETHDSSTLPTTCSCGSDVENHRLVPWTCANDDCAEVHFTATPPSACECGSTGPFVKAGLYEIAVSHECQSCGDEQLVGGECECTEPEYRTRTNPYRRYRTWDTGRTVRSPLTYRAAIPCEHSLYSTVVGGAFDELMRSPTNAGVTTSQYLLRDIAQEEGFSEAKLLAFSDSHRDMKELDRAFTEPEVDTVLDQLVLAGTELAMVDRAPRELDAETLATLQPGVITAHFEGDPATTWVSLDQVTTKAYRLLEALEAELASDDVRDSLTLNLAKTVLGTDHVADPTDRVKDRLRRRAIRHVGERPYQGGISLETAGLVDVRLASGAKSTIASEEESVVAAIIEAGSNVAIENVDADPPEGRQNIIDQLVLEGVLHYPDEGRVALTPSAIELTLPEYGTVQYEPDADKYHSQLQETYNSATGTVACHDSLRKRADVTHPRFSERAFTAHRSRVSLLLSRLYYGSTPKMERREIEHLFRDGTHPHFLSSGPTMEMGVDIGSLDTLLLYGTPPNMNAYLQRIGRAGRRSGSALVHSVSQRNPIDYYYYDEPTELITAEKQPVPLNEHNERVLRVSLAWSVLDYVAAEFVIPWETTQNNVSGGEDVVRRASATDETISEAGKFTKLMASSVSQLDLDNDKSRLRPLGITISDYESEIWSYLEELLQYAYCPRCNRHYDHSTTGAICTEEGCESTLVSALDEHGHLIDTALSAATDVFVDGYRTYVDRLRERIAAQETRRGKLATARDDASGDEATRLDREIDQLEDRIRVLNRHIDDLSGESYLTVLQDAFSEYAFSLRTVANSVGIEVVDESGEPERIGDDRSGRSSRLALGELHPGAAYLHQRRPFVVSQVFTDQKRSTDLRETVEGHAAHTVEDIGHLARDYVCVNCGAETTDPESACECGDEAWQERQLLSLESVEATLDTQSFPNGQTTARSMYNRSSERVQNTFARRETEILNFAPEEQFELATDEGEFVGTLAFGQYEILEYTESFRAKYQSGAVDDSTTEFELCAQPDCTGVIYEDDSDTRRCSVSSEHVVKDTDDAIYARLGYSYPTEGVRLHLERDSTEATHAFAHGLRLALQKLSGVTIRDVNEYVGTNHVDVFDSLEGGAAVSRLLVQERDGEYQNFQTAVGLIAKQFECDCTAGCPRCLYQYGCARRNQPRTLDRDVVTELVEKGLQLKGRSDPATDE